MTAQSLPKLEIFIYFSVWISTFIYASYHVYLAGKNVTSTSEYFEDSWFGLKKDVMNEKWVNFLGFTLAVLSKWLAGHVVLTQIIRWISPEYIPAAHCLTTLTFLWVYFGYDVAVLMILHASFYFLILQLNSITKVWVLGISFATIFCYIFYGYWIFKGGTQFSFNLIMVSSMWQHMRCTSFVIDELNSEKKSHKKFTETFYNMVGYCFYLPTYFNGPFIIYSDFGPYMYRPFKKISWQKLGLFVFNLARYLFWAAVVEASLHFLYIHALAKHMTKVAELGHWTLGGLGLLLGVSFNLYYIVFYGLAITFARFDGYNPPPPPKCGLHYHLYTNFWRVFDVGYYRFMKKYIYLPLCGSRRDCWLRRWFASSVCFSFVFFWHGLVPIVIIWSVVNWLVVSVLTLAKAFSHSRAFETWERRSLSTHNSRRLSALFATPVLILSSIGASFFLCGIEAGSLVIRQTFFNCSWAEFGVGIFICYSICQVCIETKRWERKNMTDVKPS